MTMPLMRRRALISARFQAIATVLLVAASACGTGAAEEAQASRRQAQAASEAVEDLTQRVADLESDLSSLDSRWERRLDDALEDLKSVREKLRTSLAGLREKTESTAMDALARAEEALRQLTVLEDRFEYHLRRSEGT
ncbi:MAG TPA: hypothetical protein VHJ82_08475 [Actinomycetota bacterium]|nr:hypothetical protein [Actinomycetota bacterium]